MSYVNITLDVSAAMNAERMLWKYPATFKSVLINLGDFHFIKANFSVLGKIIKGSGFEDVIFQAGVWLPVTLTVHREVLTTTALEQ